MMLPSVTGLTQSPHFEDELTSEQEKEQGKDEEKNENEKVKNMYTCRLLIRQVN